MNDGVFVELVDAGRESCIGLLAHASRYQAPAIWNEGEHTARGVDAQRLDRVSTTPGAIRASPLRVRERRG